MQRAYFPMATALELGVVSVGADAVIDVHNAAGQTHVAIEVHGYFTTSPGTGRFQAGTEAFADAVEVGGCHLWSVAEDGILRITPWHKDVKVHGADRRSAGAWRRRGNVRDWLGAFDQ